MAGGRPAAGITRCAAERLRLLHPSIPRVRGQPDAGARRQGGAVSIVPVPAPASGSRSEEGQVPGKPGFARQMVPAPRKRSSRFSPMERTCARCSNPEPSPRLARSPLPSLPPSTEAPHAPLTPAAVGRAAQRPQHLGHESCPGFAPGPPLGGSEGGNRACYCPGSVRREQKTAELYDSPIRHRRRRGAKSVL